MQLGATQFINSGEKDFAKDHAHEFDLIISTTDASQNDFPINDYLSYTHSARLLIIACLTSTETSINVAFPIKIFLLSVPSHLHLYVFCRFLPNYRMVATLEDLISEVRRRLLRCWTWSPSKASKAGSRRFRSGLSISISSVNVLVTRVAKKLWNDWIRGMCATDSCLQV